jgi:hypothetical protein
MALVLPGEYDSTVLDVAPAIAVPNAVVDAIDVTELPIFVVPAKVDVINVLPTVA